MNILVKTDAGPEYITRDGQKASTITEEQYVKSPMKKQAKGEDKESDQNGSDNATDKNGASAWSEENQAKQASQGKVEEGKA